MAMSREEAILESLINGTSYDGPVLSRVEALLLQLARAAIQGMIKKVVTSLPAVGEDNVLYLLKKQGRTSGNYCEEYLWIDGEYELIGSTDIDLSNYVTKEELDNKIKPIPLANIDSLFQ